MLQNICALLRAPKRQLGVWIRHQKLQYRFPQARLSYPILLSCDNVNALQIGTGSVIDAGGEIIVQATSTHSNVAGSLTLGNRVYIGARCNIRAGGGAIEVGDDTLIAQQVSLIASNHCIMNTALYQDQPWDEAKTGVVIGKNVWLGCGVTVLPGVEIGNNAVIGAGSVITKSVPANEVWAGVPAKKLER